MSGSHLQQQYHMYNNDETQPFNHIQTHLIMFHLLPDKFLPILYLGRAGFLILHLNHPTIFQNPKPSILPFFIRLLAQTISLTLGLCNLRNLGHGLHHGILIPNNVILITIISKPGVIYYSPFKCCTPLHHDELGFSFFK